MDAGHQVLLRKMTRREFRDRMQSGNLHLCIIPVAAIEQHLEHLAMEQDWRSVLHVANRVAERLRPHVLIAEGLLAGISEEHMRHPGTLSLSPGAFLAVLADMIDSMLRAGFHNILVLNGHGGNVAVCQGAWPSLHQRFPVNLQFLTYWDVLTAADARDLLQASHRLPDDLPGHAQEFETSFALAAFPENVRTDIWTEQADPTPACATGEAGRLFIQRIEDRVTKHVQDMIHGRRIAEPPPFFP